MKMMDLIFAATTVVLPAVALAETKITNSMEEVQTIFAETKGETLGVFDVDMVLIQSSEPAFQMLNMMAHKPLLKSLLESLNPIEKDVTINLTTQQSPSILIEKQTPALIKKIQDKHPKCIALTAALTGSLGSNIDQSTRRYEQLKAVGINFSSSFPAFKSIVFDNFPPYRNNYPEFKEGILCSNGEGSELGKGKVLVEFLKKVNYEPQTIIFIDDREKNIVDVEKALLTYNSNIRYIGLVYKGADHYPTKMVDEKSFREKWLEVINQSKIIANAVLESQ